MPLSGFPKDQTNPDPINVDQEPLVFRRYCFSQYLSLLIPTFSFPAAPAYLTVHLQRRLECSPTNLPYGIFYNFGTTFDARSFSVPEPSTSELLRTL